MAATATKFRLLELLDDGPHTAVYRAVREGERPQVLVLKVVKPAHDGTVDGSRLRHECEVAARVRSETVIEAYGLTTFEGQPALMLEDIGGQSLERALPLPLDLPTFLRVGVQVARALEAVHMAQVVHGDLRPHNLIVEPSSLTVKLTDFGAAIVRGRVQPESSERRLQGMLAYIAPEQTGRLGRSVDHRADLYALGVIFYELLTGKRPFEAADALEWMHCHIARAPQPLVELRPELPPLLSALVLRLLAKAPEERYQSAQGLAHDLERCKDDLASSGRIDAFGLGEHDPSHEFKIPQRLYGRDREVAQLRAAFARVVARGRAEILCVSGYSGVGKTSLVRELQSPIARERGLFVSGKFDQFQRDIPYSALAQAVSELVHQVLSVSAERLRAWTVRLEAALGPSGDVLTEIFPPLELLIGRRPKVSKLGPQEKQNRLCLAFSALLEVFATKEHPVVLFLDDLQWADPASLELLESFWTRSADATSLLSIFAYREHEVAATHPFSLMMERLRRAGTAIETVEVAPLESAAICALLADTLHVAASSCARLAQLVVEKTQGNPFFVNEFLKTLHLDGLLRFDPASHRWRWQQAELEERSITDNVVQMLVERLRRLSPETQRALQLAACIGGRFELSVLALASECSPSSLAEPLSAALEQGLILQEQADHYRFQHDRIQQAAYSLIDDQQKHLVHLRIGRILSAKLDPPQLDARLFEVVNHLNLARDRITDPSERSQLRALNVRAGKKAKAATAYTQAVHHLTLAVALSSPGGAAASDEQTFDFQTELAECEYLTGQLEAAEQRFVHLYAHAGSDLDRGKILYLQMKLYQVAGDFERACTTALRSFELFGLAPPKSDEEASEAVQREHEAALSLLGERRPFDLLQLPRMEDPTVRMIADLLESSAPPLYMARPALFPWIVLKLLTYSLRHGNAEPSCYGYGVYALVRAATMGDVEGGYEFAQLAIQLNEQLDDVRLRGCVLHLLGDHVNFWVRPIATDLPILERGFSACLEGGDLIYSNYIGFQSPWHLYESGAPLHEVSSLCERYASFALRTRHLPVHQTIRIEQQFVRCLQGKTSRPGSLDDAGFSEAAALAEIVHAKFGCGVVYHAILSLIASYTFGDLGAAQAAAEQAQRELAAAFSMPIHVSYTVYRALTLAALHVHEDEAGRARTLESVQGHLSELERWERGCPENFTDKRALVAAELARLTGQVAAAMRLYEEAREAARRQGLTQYEALACERAASLYRESGVDSVAAAFFRDALALYRTWGADGKAAQLEAQYASFVERKVMLGRTPTPTRSEAENNLDLLPVIKASQTISGEMLLPRLLERLMSIVIEYAGADRGQLLLYEADQRLVVAADASVGSVRKLAGEESPFQLGAKLPESVLHYVARTKEWVLLEDAELPNPFSSDPYFAHQKPRSLLCMPIVRKGRLTGLFYLENSLMAGAFGAERLTVLELLSAQTAISIDNSRLYEASQSAIRMRDEFISMASHELKTPLTPIKMNLQTLLDRVRRSGFASVPEEQLVKVLQSSDAQLSRLARLVDELLEVSRVQYGSLPLARERIDLTALTAQLLERQQPELARAGCHVSFETSGPVVGWLDPTRIEQAITNLLLNAIKYGPGKPVRIDVSQRGGKGYVRITDRGVGIAAADLKRIFERFERVASDSNVSGLGLGLYITRGIVAAHGGVVSVESELGLGTTFTVELPL